MKTMQSAVWGRGQSFGLLVGLVVGLLATGRGASAAIIEQNPWDTLTRPGWSYDSGSHFIDATSGTPNAPNALRFTYPTGFTDGNGPGIAEYAISPRDEIYYGYWFKFSNNFQSHSAVNKMSFFWHNSTELITEVVSGGGITCVAGADCSLGKFVVRANHPTIPGESQMLGQNQAFNPTIAWNTWYWVEVHLVMNTPGVANGILEVWLNDQLISSYTNAFYRRSGQTGGWETFMHSATYGGNAGEVKAQTDYLWFDQTTFSTTRIGRPGSPPPSCPADPGAALCEDFDDGNLTGWAVRDPSTISLATPGLNSTTHKVQLYASPTNLGGAELDTSVSLPTRNGETFWVEWWEQYHPNFEWGYDAGELDEHKEVDLRNDAPSGARVLYATQDKGTTAGFPEIQFMADPECFPAQYGCFFFGPNVDPDFTLQPGQTYHFILQITNAPNPNGAFKLWANDRLIMDYSGVGVCGRSSGDCTWTDLMLGGPQARSAPGGNYLWFDQIRITKTNIAPTATPDTTAPSIPTMNPPSVVSSSQINLSWTASTDTGGSGLAGYHLERCQGATCTTFTEIASLAAPATSYPNTGLTANTTYRYRVRARDHANLFSPYSNLMSAVTRGDLTGDGKVDLEDLRTMIYMLIGTVPPDLTKADLDGDGQLLLVDLQALVRILVGLP